MAISTTSLQKLLLIITGVAVVILFFVRPLPQDDAFHHFVDQRSLFFIPNYWNVLSNLGFLWVGLLGCWQLMVPQNLNIIPSIKINYLVFFIGITLVSIGSGYYHWHPNNQTLIWDRLPMTIAFMALSSIAITEFMDVKWGKNTLWPLLFIGFTSVIYWYWGEMHNAGDLRLYMLVQFLPMVILPILFLLGKPSFKNNWGYWLLLLAYVLAKAAEYFDSTLFKLTGGFLAGHAIKHLLVVAGLYALLKCMERRQAAC